MTYFIPLLLIVSAGPIAASEGDERSTAAPQEVAMEFITAAFFKRDVNRAATFVKADAERKSYGKGSVIGGLREDIPKFPPAKELVLREIHFALNHDLERIGRRLIAFKSERDGVKLEDASVDVKLLRKSLRVTDASFVTLLIWRYGSADDKAKFAHMLFVFDSIDGQWKITYMTDD